MSVRVEIDDRVLLTHPGCTLFECAEELGVYIPTSCMKQGTCGECLVEVESGMELLSDPAPAEEHLDGAFRLACRARLISGKGSIRCHTLRRGSMRIAEESVNLPGGARPDEWDPAVVRRGEKICLEGEEIARSRGPIYGVAVDLGTSTVVMRLVNLETGVIEASQSFENPQRFAGSNVMSRIQFDVQNGDRLLQRTLIGYMRHVIEAFPCNGSDIYEMTVVGNTTMREIFFGLEVYSIGQKPYHSLIEEEHLAGKRSSTALLMKASRFELPLHPEGQIYGLPLIGSHVGADAAACLLAVNMAAEDQLIGVMDIGTNTEVILGNRLEARAASCPAGPAFEGMGLSCGMPGLEGAIDRIRLQNGTVSFDVIGGGPPQGICGSGLVDLLSELRRTGRMNSAGRLTDSREPFWIDREKNLFLTEKDISLLAQAKGANVAGLRIASLDAGKRFEDLDLFYLAGGFAQYLDVDAAKRIGLIPDLPEQKIVQLGNAAIEGSTMALLSLGLRRRLEEFVGRVQHLELETDPHFFDYFVDGCMFDPVTTGSRIPGNTPRPIRRSTGGSE